MHVHVSAEDEERRIQEIEEAFLALLPSVPVPQAQDRPEANSPTDVNASPKATTSHPAEYSTPKQEVVSLTTEELEACLARSSVDDLGEQPKAYEDHVGEQPEAYEDHVGEQPEAYEDDRGRDVEAQEPKAPRPTTQALPESIRPDDQCTEAPVENLIRMDTPSPVPTSVPQSVVDDEGTASSNYCSRTTSPVPAQSVPTSPLRQSPRKHYYPPVSARSALVEASRNSSRDGSPTAQPADPISTSAQGKYVWSPLPPNQQGADSTIRAAPSPSTSTPPATTYSRGRPELPASFYDAGSGGQAVSPSASSSSRSRYFQDTQSWDRYREMAAAVSSVSPVRDSRTGDHQYG